MAKSKTEYDFFKQEIESDDVIVMEGHEVGNPTPNSTGSYNLDFDLVIPFPAGRITEIFGSEGTCKTTLALEALGAAIARGEKGLYVNAEKNLNLSLMRTVRTLRPYLDDALAGNKECPLWIVNATTGEQALESMRKFASMVPNGIAVLDSIDAAQPEAVLSGEIGKQQVGNLGKLMSDAMRKLIGVSESNRVALIFINQTRDKITMFGDPTTTPGGSAVRFYSSQRIKLEKPRKVDIVEFEGDKIGVQVRYKIIKNKTAPDGNEGVFPVLFKNGIFRELELVQLCCNLGVLRMGGKGGKQVFLPQIDRDTGEFVMKDGEMVATCMSQFNAARRLLMDEVLTAKLHICLQEALDPGGHDPMDDLVDEVQES